MAAKAITVTNLEKSYNSVKALDGISFEVECGQVFGMLGPNGAGKSTTIEILVGLRERDSGDIRILGSDPKDSPKDLRARVGVQLQAPALYPRLTVKEVVHLFGSFYPKRLHTLDVIDRVGLSEKANAKVGQLSGGQLHRLAIAIAMVNDGDLIFLDEPTTGLDPQARRSLWELIMRLKADGKTVFLTTHYMDEAERLCDQLIIVDYGKIIAEGSPAELIGRYFGEKAIEFKNPPLNNKEFLSDLPGVSRVEIDGETITLYSSEVPLSISGLMEASSGQGTPIDDLTIRQATLEDVFLKLTGRRIRE